MPAYVAVLKGGTIVEAYHLVRPDRPSPSDGSIPVSTEEDFLALPERLEVKYPRPEYDVVQGGFGNLQLLVENRALGHYEYDFLDKSRT